MRLKSSIFCASALLFVCASLAQAADKGWPRELDTPKGVLTIYQPQPEKFEDNVLDGRAAISLIPKGKTTPVFGVRLVHGPRRHRPRLGTGDAARHQGDARRAGPRAREAKEADSRSSSPTLMPKTGIPISLERLKASLAAAEKEKKSVEGLKHDPPKIVFTEEIVRARALRRRAAHACRSRRPISSTSRTASSR